MSAAGDADPDYMRFLEAISNGQIPPDLLPENLVILEDDSEDEEFNQEDEEEEEEEEDDEDEDEDEEEEDDVEDEEYDEEDGNSVTRPRVLGNNRSNRGETTPSTPGSALTNEECPSKGRHQSPGVGKDDGSGGNGEEWSRTDIDGLFCPICMDAWTCGGDHQVCCLPCGHIYGMSCIKKWLRQRKASGKCPQCNSKCTLKDVRLLYASRIVVVDEVLQKKVRDLESRCATLEKEGADWRKKEHEWNRKETDLRMQVNQLRERTRYIDDLSRNAQVRPSPSFSGSHFVSKIDGQKFPDNFGLQGELNIEGARLFDVDAVNQCIIVARRISGMGGGHVLTKVSLLPPYEKEDYALPSGTKAIKDLQLSPHSRLVLLASLGKTLSVISTESNNAILSYDLPTAAWSCSWDYNNSHSMYAGLQNGMVLQFDMRQTSKPVQSMTGLTQNPIHTMHSLSADVALGSGIRSVLSASSVGLCQWNFGGCDERPTLIPESENQGVCISLAYSPLSDNIVASFRPKIEMLGDTSFSQHTPFHSTPISGQCVHGSHVFYKRIGSKYQYCGSTTANMNHIRLPKSVVIDRKNKHALFASGDEVTGDLVLRELPSFEVVQRFSTPSRPMHDLRYVDMDNSELLCCLSENRLQLFK